MECTDCRDGVREEFFKALAGVSFCAHARLWDKALWPAAYLKATTGPGRIQDQIVSLIVECPVSVTSGQTLLIDGKKIKGGKIPSPKGALNRALASKGRRGLGKVRFCTDHNASQGAIVQVADMVAGALNDSWAIRGPYLSRIRGKVTLV